MTWHDAPRPETPEGRLLSEAVLMRDDIEERNRNILRHGNTRISIGQQALQRIAGKTEKDSVPHYMLGAKLYTIARYFPDSYPLNEGESAPPIDHLDPEAQATYRVTNRILQASQNGTLPKFETWAMGVMATDAPRLTDFVDQSLGLFKNRDTVHNVQLAVYGMAGAALMRSIDIKVGRQLARPKFLRRLPFGL